MKQLVRNSSLLAIAVTVTGCGEPVAEEDAAVAWEATYKVLNGGPAGFRAADDQIDIGSEITTDCAEGGTATFEADVEIGDLGDIGDINGTDDIPEISAKYEVTFDGCTVDGIVIDGKVDYETNGSPTDDGYELDFSVDGDLDYSGEVEGSCKIELEGSGSTSLSGSSASAQFEFSGTICGYDASENLSVNG